MTMDFQGVIDILAADNTLAWSLIESKGRERNRLQLRAKIKPPLPSIIPVETTLQRIVRETYEFCPLTAARYLQSGTLLRIGEFQRAARELGIPHTEEWNREITRTGSKANLMYHIVMLSDDDFTEGCGTIHRKEHPDDWLRLVAATVGTEGAV